MPRQKRPKLKRRADGRFRLRYDGHEFYSKPWAADERECYEQRDEYIRQKQLGLARSITGPTIQEYAVKWLKREKINASDQTYAEAACLLEKLTKHLGNSFFRDVKPSDVKDVYGAEFSGLSDSYIKAGAQLYRALFDAAMDDGLCTSNPARAKSAQPHKGKEVEGHRAITAQEREWINTLCLDHRCHPAVMAMLYAGIRPQEAKALDIDRDVDFEKGVLYVRESVHMDGSNQYQRTTELKTKQSKREIPLFPPLREALLHRNDREAGKAQAKAEARAKRLKKPLPEPPKKPEKEPYGMLVRSATGKPVTVQAWRSAWESYVSEMETAINGCPERWWGKKKEQQGKTLPPFVHFTVVPYDLRHSFCTMCRDANPPVEINTVIHWMGHKDAKMILAIYDEYSQERGKNEAEKLEKSLFGGQNRGQK